MKYLDALGYSFIFGLKDKATGELLDQVVLPPLVASAELPQQAVLSGDAKTKRPDLR